MRSLCILSLVAAIAILAAAHAAEQPTGALYTGNREPLLPSPFMKLPIGSITPRGWLRQMLVLESKGETGRLEEISRWCKFEGNAWTDPTGTGHSGWEEMPYWLKGYQDLGYVLKDPAIIKESRKWVEAILATQAPDGWFGPKGLRTSLDGKPDLWPNMIALNALQSFYEATGDERVLPLMTRYFRWELQCPDADFLAGYWPRMRAGDNIESVYWLYNRTGEAWLLDVAKKLHEHAADWTGGVANWHGVNIAQGFREPGVYYQQARDRKFLHATEADYRTVLDMYGQVPGGTYGADENCRAGYTDPRQGFETCSIVEFMHSFEMLTKITGDSIWADRCEEQAFNVFPAALTPDLRALHYFTCPNQVQLDRANKSPGIQNRGNMFAYSPHLFRCCQHNVSHGWPYYAEELWLATPDRGLCASLYAASEVSARVADGTQVTIDEETDYPFSDTITLKLSTPKPVRFPLHLRIPGWCRQAAVQVNGRPEAVKAAPGSYAILDRQWADGDTVTLRLPMEISVRTWAKNKGAVSVQRGPLIYSLKIGERWERSGGTDEWPEQEVFPTTPWNYGLVLDAANPSGSFQVAQKAGVVPAQPFTPDAAPISLQVKARRIPGWTMEANGLVGKLQQSPIRSDEPEETVTLIPMGCARLRITAFPTIGAGPGAHEWEAVTAPATASHCNSGDTIEALNDGVEPTSSIDRAIPRMTWWDHRGTAEWVQYDFAKPRRVSSVAVYWFDDTGAGQCRVPQSWKLLYRAGNEWKPVEAAGDYGVKPDAYNKVSFPPVETTGLRLDVQLQPDFSGGILEWKVE